MDAGVVDVWRFGTACELLFGKCVSSVSHGHRWRISEASGNPTASGVPETICTLAPSSATISADLRTSDPRSGSCCRAAVCANAVSRHAANPKDKPSAPILGQSRLCAGRKPRPADIAQNSGGR